MSWSTYANRGNALEELVIYTNNQYKNMGLARIDRVPTPSSVQGGFYKDKSTVDFTGVLNGGRAVVFDCKETKEKSLPLKNIHQHQIEYMQDIINLGGIAFLVVNFKSGDEYYRLEFEVLEQYWIEWKNKSGRASIPRLAFTKRIKQENRFMLHYLKGLIG